MENPILHLNLKGRWFKEILLHEKKEEYREIKPFWNRIFVNGYIKIKGRCYHPTDVDIVFSNGYAKNRPQILVQCKGLCVGGGLEKWGARPGDQYFVLLLGRILKSNHAAIEMEIKARGFQASIDDYFEGWFDREDMVNDITYPSGD